MNTPANPPGGADMEEILSSIRSTLEEETGRVAKEQGAAGATPAAEDVLELDASDMVPEGVEVAAGADVPAVDEIFDINAFATEGKEAKVSGDKLEELKKDGLGEDETVQPVDVVAVEQKVEEAPAGGTQEQAAADDFDRLLNELQTDTPSVAAPATPAPAPVAAPTAPVEAAPVVPVAVEEVAMAVVEEALPGANGKRLQLPVVPGVSGLQVALPAEILAEALRPLVKDWVAENLAQVVERLVADEIEKLVKD